MAGGWFCTLKTSCKMVSDDEITQKINYFILSQILIMHTTVN